MNIADETLTEVRTLLPVAWSIYKEGTSTQSFNILDSYGGVLLSSGITLLEYTGKTAKVELLPEKIEEKLSQPGPGLKYDPGSFVNVELRSIVCSRIGEWRLTTRASGTETIERYRLENEDQKGVARILLRTFKCASGSPITCMEVQPYRGYSQEVSSVQSSLEAMNPLSAVLPEFLRSLPEAVRGLSELPPNVQSDRSAREAVVDLGRYLIDRVRFYEPGVIEDIDPEVLHQYRVTLRRMRSLVILLKKVFNAKEQEALKTTLKAVMQHTNRLRDLDVQIVEIGKIRPSLPKSLQPGLDRFIQHLAGERKQVQKSVHKSLVSAPFDTRLAQVTTVFDNRSEQEPETISHLLLSTIVKHYRRIAREISALTDDVEPEKLHDIRISCKKLRYLLEFFPQLLLQVQVKPFIKDLKKLQNLLGRFNDICVLETFLLDRENSLPDDKVALMAIGVIIMQIHEEKNRLTRQCVIEAHNFCSTKHRKSIRQVLRGGSD